MKEMAPEDEELLRVQEKKNKLKEELEEQERLNKQIQTDKPVRRLGLSAAATLACAGACVAGKLDKKITGIASVVSFLAVYFLHG